MGNGRTVTALVSLIAVSLGFVIGRIQRDFSSFEIDKEIDPVALAALLLSVGVSILFYRYFERRKHSDQLVKAAVLERHKAILMSLAALEERCTTARAPFADVVKGVKRCRRDFESFSAYAEALEFGIEPEERMLFRKRWGQLKALLTNTPRRGTVSPPLTVANNQLTLSAPRVVEVEAKIDEVRSQLYSIERSIITRV